jgi:hypothetical protein
VQISLTSLPIPAPVARFATQDVERFDSVGVFKAPRPRWRQHDDFDAWIVRVHIHSGDRVELLPVSLASAEDARFVVDRLNSALATAREPTTYR